MTFSHYSHFCERMVYYSQEGAKMFMDLYYENYNSNSPSSSMEKVLPYLIKIPDNEQRNSFCNFLKAEGFKQVCWGTMTNAVLVNMQFRRFGNLPKPVGTACVDSRDYTMEEFLDEVYYKSR